MNKPMWSIIGAGISTLVIIGCIAPRRTPVPRETPGPARTPIAQAVQTVPPTQTPTLGEIPGPTQTPTTKALPTLAPTQAPTLRVTPGPTATPAGGVLPRTGPHTAPAGNRVIRLMLFSNGIWGFDGRNGRAYETPDSVLTMIAELKPDILDRFFNDPVPDLNAPLQYRDQAGRPINWQEAQGAGGFPAGSIGSFLYRAIQGRVYYPRLGSELYDPASPSAFFARAEQLYANAVALGVPPDQRFLALDNWANIFRHNSIETVNTILATLYSQGWQGIGITDLGQYSSTANIAAANAPTWASFNVQGFMSRNAGDWLPDRAVLPQMHTDPYLQRYFLYIDFPRTMQNFMNLLTPDQEADVLTTLARLQNPNPADAAGTGYTFVYPIGQTFWDMNTRVTSPTGPYGGMTLYQIVRDKLLPTYNP